MSTVLFIASKNYICNSIISVMQNSQEINQADTNKHLEMPKKIIVSFSDW